VALRSQATPPSLSTALDGVDPGVARVVDRCLSTDPMDRPGSATAVAAALPGGDPLAAALAAGETPSPELIAEAGASEGFRTRTAMLVLLAGVLGIGIVAWLSTQVTLASRVGLDRPPAVLVDRAEEIVREAGWDDNYAWVPNWPYYQDVRRRDTDFARWDALSRLRPAGFLFIYRGSPFDLQPYSQGSIGNWMGDPPPLSTGMVEVRLDPSGRLVAFRGIPERADNLVDAPGETGTKADFDLFFAAAGLEPQAFHEIEPTILPRVFADRRYAWEGRYPDLDDEHEAAIRVEAASIRGRPVTFSILQTWDVPTEEGGGSEPGFWDKARDILESAWFVVVVIGAAIVAARNIRLGRGDHRTALRFGLYLALVRLVWLLDAHLQGDPVQRLTGHMAWAAYRLCLSYIFYMALEPYARRLWPEMLVSWVRAFSGRLRDARVGRDLMIGVATGCAFAVILDSTHWAMEMWQRHAVPGRACRHRQHAARRDHHHGPRRRAVQPRQRLVRLVPRLVRLDRRPVLGRAVSGGTAGPARRFLGRRAAARRARDARAGSLARAADVAGLRRRPARDALGLPRHARRAAAVSRRGPRSRPPLLLLNHSG
jgi:serine/threonine-protein kinase